MTGILRLRPPACVFRIVILSGLSGSSGLFFVRYEYVYPRLEVGLDYLVAVRLYLDCLA